MQFVSIPMASLIRPTVCPFSLPQSTPLFNVVMSFALAADFKKYAIAYVLNDRCSS